ncbi:MAG: DUF1016 family protein [Sulfurimonas sp.]|nr:DUF1016 family protein [Sulfurimonas sp.]
MAKSIELNYKDFILDIKTKIKSSQLKAHVKVNKELLKLYWELAKMIVEKQKQSSWGDGFLKDISRDLKSEFPNMKGFSYRNIKYIRQWYNFYNEVIGQQAVAQLEIDKIFQIPWGHNIAIITKTKEYKEASFYIDKTIQNNYSRAMLMKQIENNLYKNSGNAITNFKNTLPQANSSLAIESVKNPYNFDFLDIRAEHDEKELEDALVDNMTNFLLELGSGFAFIGRQYKLKVEENTYKIDLLFYHTKLHCYVVIELKTVDFKPEFAGKLNFYISAIDTQIKSKEDNPTIGIIICKSKNDTLVEYSLRDIQKPLGISEYELTEILPKELESSLPSIEQIEAEFMR